MLVGHESTSLGSSPDGEVFRLTPKKGSDSTRLGWLSVQGWQISQRPLAVHKGGWEDKLLSGVMARFSLGPGSMLQTEVCLSILSFSFTCVNECNSG